MNSYAIKAAFLLGLIFFTGCASYHIPCQTQDHPASSNAPVSQIELSPILDLEEHHVQ